VDQLLMFEQELEVQCGSYGYESSIQETLGILLAFFTQAGLLNPHLMA
jgi:hypothetical protein